ncbi:MAG: MCE family protein [Verrucomicrobia bacterium]|nr:MCE family protein [Verrucomicrobiota bacterium]
MQIFRNEVRTGLLVLLTLGLVVGVILYISSPGLFRPLKTFRVYFDDAAGIKPGAAVMLAGRKIGIVADIQSPVPVSDRPAGSPDSEAMVVVKVANDSQIFKQSAVTMRSFGLLAELVIDFNHGNPLSGLAEQNEGFLGTRSPDLAEVGPQIIQKLDPALSQVELTLQELKRTSVNLTLLTEPKSPLVDAVKNFQSVTSNLKVMTAKDGPIEEALNNIHLTLGDLRSVTAELDKNQNLGKALANFNAGSAKLKTILDSTDRNIAIAFPRINLILQNVSELTLKLKQQPWRVLWPSTIKYPDQPGAQVAGQPTPLRRRAAFEAQKSSP